MRSFLRVILPLTLVFLVSAYGVVPLVDNLALKWFIRDLESRSDSIVGASHDLIASHVGGDTVELNSFLNHFSSDEGLYALGFCNLGNKSIAHTPKFPENVSCADLLDYSRSEVWKIPQGHFHLSCVAILKDGKNIGNLFLMHNLSLIEARIRDLKKYILFFFITVSFLISLVTDLIAQLGIRRWIKNLRSALRRVDFVSPILTTRYPELRPIVRELRDLIKDLKPNSAIKDESQMTWSAKKLKEILQKDLSGEEVLIISNREPYIHSKHDGKIEVQVPASGVVTALEPIMRACSGTWIAHGSGNADREVVDVKDHIQVPPGNPSYQLRRIWLSDEEERGYYYGFSNEGLWPLCHIAYARPLFRSEDWKQYQEVNNKFAEAAVKEAKTRDPIILIQDYHFALLPKMIKEKLPRATIVTFWHIPWPNPEAFGICPWREELLEGLLGSDILGFQTRFHCNNFLDTVDRFLESRIDRETSTITHRRKETAINRYPISVEWPVRWLKTQKTIAECKRVIYERHQLGENQVVGIAVDRLDYTKGIIERFLAVEKLLEKHPKWIGKFTLIQIASPSRSIIDRYIQLGVEVKEAVEKINNRFGRENYKPIILVGHQDPENVFEYMRAADLCFVNSLHDGMNLVAKEYVSAKENDLGVLILSQFAGSAKELFEALIVNPYDIDQCSEALEVALEMPLEEQKSRMHNMRRVVEEFNVYRWAGRMLLDASMTRQKNWFNKRFGAGTMIDQPLR